MHHLIVLRAIGGLLALLALGACVPLLVAILYREPTAPWLWTMATGLAVGLALLLTSRRADPASLGLREGLAITTITWVAGSALAAIGLWLDVDGLPFLDAWFEMLSGLTTAGATIFGGWSDADGVAHGTRIADLSHGTLAWRALAHFLGGIGIVVMSVALLPLVGSGSGFQLYRSEITGIDSSRLAPRVVSTARILVGYYLLIAAVVTVALWLAGVSAFDAWCHAVSAISTGGFANYDDSISGLRNHAAEWILIATMVVGGLNFALLISALRGHPGRLWRSAEVRLYLSLIVVAFAVMTVLVGVNHAAYRERLPDLVRDSLFQVVSVITSTGFSSGMDVVPGGWEAWAPSAQVVMLLLMVGGACAGSTSGGAKLVRMMVLAKLLRREVRRHVEPARLSPIMLDGRPIGDAQVLHVFGFFVAFAASWAAGTLGLVMTGVPLETAGCGALACLANVGPALGELGAGHNFGGLSDPAKGICMALMLLGRLEFLGVLITLTPRTWMR